MVLKNNKSGSVGIGMFGFFFVLMVFSSVFFFLSFGMHYILYDYALIPIQDLVAEVILDTNGQHMQNIRILVTSYLGLVNYYDLLFLVLVVSAFVESTIASIKAKETGFLSFFGMVTIGNLFLIYILFYATQIQGWILNEVLFNVILINPDTPILTFFINNGIFVCLFWFLWVVGMNQIDLERLKEKIPNIFPSKVSNLLDDEGKFEE